MYMKKEPPGQKVQAALEIEYEFQKDGLNLHF